MRYGEVSSNGLRVRRRDKRVWFVVLGMFVSVFLFSFLVQRFKNDGEVGAASLAGFDPGYIISDYQMGNYNSMSEAEIQNFLTSKNPCNNRDYNYYRSLSGATWHWEDGHFVCLSEERFGDGEVIGSGDTAAHIIWQTAQDYRINPQVLLVLLQKETGLITDPIPNNYDYRKATGYGCPDTAACSSKYYGFKNQLRNAAALFRAVLDGGWTNYPLGDNYIQYNPNAACGGSVVNIRSLATSALYRYTPYQPNAGALAAGYGTASCGAYGNRNFYLYFEDWFGGITSDGYMPLDTPRYMVIKNDTERINPHSEEIIDTLPAGMIRKFTSKVRLPSNQWCLRTEYSTNNKMNACIRIDDLDEITLEYDDIEKNEQYKTIKAGAKKTFIRGGSNTEGFNNGMVRKMVKKVNFNGVVYYITEYDASLNNSEYGFSEQYVEDILGFEPFINPRYFEITKNVNRINPYTGEYYDTLEKGRILKYNSKININGTWYYRTEYMTEKGLDIVVPSSAVKEL